VDNSPSKRDDVIEKLLYSPESVERCTMGMGDWLQNTLSSVNVSRESKGRNAYYNYIRDAVTPIKPFQDLAYELITTLGNNYDGGRAANFTVAAVTPMGPPHDMSDTMLLNPPTPMPAGSGYFPPEYGPFLL